MLSRKLPSPRLRGPELGTARTSSCSAIRADSDCATTGRGTRTELSDDKCAQSGQCIRRRSIHVMVPMRTRRRGSCVSPPPKRRTTAAKQHGFLCRREGCASCDRIRQSRRPPPLTTTNAGWRDRCTPCATGDNLACLSRGGAQNGQALHAQARRAPSRPRPGPSAPSPSPSAPATTVGALKWAAPCRQQRAHCGSLATGPQPLRKARAGHSFINMSLTRQMPQVRRERITRRSSSPS